MTRAITIEDLYRLRFVSQPRLSPDGSRVAFVVTTIDEREHEYRSAIWVALPNGEVRRFTSGRAKAHSPSWSPDGRWLAFVSDRDSDEPAASPAAGGAAERRAQPSSQIWLLPADGGEARQLTWMEHGAERPVWSPDGRYLLFSAQVGPSDEKTPAGKPLPKARVIERLWYRLDGVGFIHERRSHLFLIPVEGGEPVQLTDGDWDDADAAWSPDGQQIAFVSSRAEDRWRMPCPDLYTLTIISGQPGELRCWTNGSLSCSSPSWSPDGRHLAFLAMQKYRSANHVDLYVLSLEEGAIPGQVQPLCLTSDFEGSCVDWTNSDLGDEHLMPPPGWSADGQTLYALASRRGATRLYVIPMSGAGPEPPTLTPGAVHVRDFSLDQAGQRVALLMGSATQPPEIYRCSLTTTAPGPEAGQGAGAPTLEQVSHCNDELLRELKLASPEYLPYRGCDDWPMDGWLLRPPDYDPARRYPLIVEIHGGPNTQYGYGFFHEMQVLAAAGYVILYTNPRGSCGYGREFALAVRGAWGEKDSLDILAGIDAALQQGGIDEQRIGVIGGSYGGFMTAWLIGHSHRFRAAVADRSVTNLVSDFGSSDFGWTFADDELDTTPWEDLERYWRMSPLAYVQHMRTPLLILHSEQDLRCNIEQADQLFAALKYLGREVRYVRFEGQSHGLSRGGHPSLRLQRLRFIVDWFEHHLREPERQQ
ncbi:MAG: S9 family peptidase [Thermogemmatispora sp.]|uniref:S9 family peptidase n=1 Tax=Thermogemmatispora sp. TaxID=1968838 RepID=UPI0019D8CAE9|nr:S9 family peptidase [Thermogemmatispora sp.]MBE3564272.1 S9 family peptidase [Thermogemmatispora sp.]